MVSEDSIALRRMVFYGFHGDRSEERALGQRFIVNVVLTADLSQAGASDLLQDTVDYGKVYSVVKRIVEGPPLNLLETLGERICGEVMRVSDLIESVEVVLVKPAVPLRGALDGAEVRLIRRRAGC